MSWQEADGTTVTNVQPYHRVVVHSFITLPDGTFQRMSGSMEITQLADQVSDDRPLHNQAPVLEAMTARFQRRDVSAVEGFYAADYV